MPLQDGASFCYCAYVLRIPGYSSFLTLYRQRFTAKAVFEVLWCQMPLNFATKAFSYILAQF